VGDLLNASFFLDPGDSQLHSPSSDTDVGVYVDDFVMEAGNADGKVATADQSERAADEGMLLDVGGFEVVAEGFFRACVVNFAIVARQRYLGVGGAGVW